MLASSLALLNSDTSEVSVASEPFTAPSAPSRLHARTLEVSTDKEFTSHDEVGVNGGSWIRPCRGNVRPSPVPSELSDAAYVDGNLLGTGKLNRAAIIGLAGGIWAASAGYSVSLASA